MIRTYALLAKPGIVFGNLATTIAAFLLASYTTSPGKVDWGLLEMTALGLAGVIGSACVFNNAIDRQADQLMARTKSRALAAGSVSLQSALFFAVVLGSIGLALLAFYANLLAAGIAVFGFFVYVAMYSFWKYRTAYATLVGSVAGALPPVIGYCAASRCLDVGAALLFLILVLWQMPHFFAIALYRSEEYAAASIPVWPLEKGTRKTKIQMLLYTAAFLAAAPLLSVCGYTGRIYLIASLVLGLAWLLLCARGFKAQSGKPSEKPNEKQWARQMFFLSLAVVMALSLLLALDAVPPAAA